MLQLRVFGDVATMGDVARRLEASAGARHNPVAAGVREGSALLIADVTPAVADQAIEIIRGLGVPDADFTLAHVDAIGVGMAADEPVTIVWADLLSQARVNARAPPRAT